jgi:hypothetical protein
MTLREKLDAYQMGARWIARDNSNEVTAKTRRAAMNELKAGKVAERDRQWNDEDDDVWELARDIACDLAGGDPWGWNNRLNTPAAHAEIQTAELTMRHLVLLGQVVRAAAKKLGLYIK